MGLIYLLTIKCNDGVRKLIGQTRQKLGGRIRGYKWSLKHNCKSSPKLQNYYNKYGWKAIEFQVLEECENENMSERERFYIDQHNTFKSDLGLNMTSGGEMGKILSDESRKKIGDKHRGKIITDRHRRNLRVSREGRQPCLGLVHTDETKRKIAKSLGIRPFFLKNTDNGETIKCLSKSEAAKKIEGSRRTVSRILKNGKKFNSWIAYE